MKTKFIHLRKHRRSSCIGQAQDPCFHAINFDEMKWYIKNYRIELLTILNYSRYITCQYHLDVVQLMNNRETLKKSMNIILIPQLMTVKSFLIKT